MPVRAAAIAANKNKRRRRSSAQEDIAARKARAEAERNRNIGICGNKHHDRVAKFFKFTIRDKKWFQSLITGVICMAGVLVGVQTYEVTSQPWVDAIAWAEEIVVAIFVAEIVVKLIAEGRFPWKYFLDGWNVFDFLIVVVGFMPFAGSAVTALRLVRLLRVLKLVRALPKLRILVMGLLKSLSSIAYIGLLLMLLFYLYAVLGVLVFGDNDPIHMGTLHIAFLTLFRCATLEDWTDVMYIGMEGCDKYGYDGNEHLCTSATPQPIFSVVYFCSFIILSSMMILNLFIGVITSSMADAKSDLSAELESEKAAKEEQPEEMMLGRLLRDMTEIMEEVTGELEVYADLERERQSVNVLQLSQTNVFQNKEIEMHNPAKDATALDRRNFQGRALSGSTVHHATTDTPKATPASSRSPLASFARRLSSDTPGHTSRTSPPAASEKGSDRPILGRYTSERRAGGPPGVYATQGIGTPAVRRPSHDRARAGAGNSHQDRIGASAGARRSVLPPLADDDRIRTEPRAPGGRPGPTMPRASDPAGRPVDGASGGSLGAHAPTGAQSAYGNGGASAQSRSASANRGQATGAAMTTPAAVAATAAGHTAPVGTPGASVSSNTADSVDHAQVTASTGPSAQARAAGTSQLTANDGARGPDAGDQRGASGSRSSSVASDLPLLPSQAAE